jgi:hypothetical protein
MAPHSPKILGAALVACSLAGIAPAVAQKAKPTSQLPTALTITFADASGDTVKSDGKIDGADYDAYQVVNGALDGAYINPWSTGGTIAGGMDLHLVPSAAPDRYVTLDFGAPLGIKNVTGCALPQTVNAYNADIRFNVIDDNSNPVGIEAMGVTAPSAIAAGGATAGYDVSGSVNLTPDNLPGDNDNNEGTGGAITSVALRLGQTEGLSLVLNGDTWTVTASNVLAAVRCWVTARKGKGSDLYEMGLLPVTFTLTAKKCQLVNNEWVCPGV